METILDVRNLKVFFDSAGGPLSAVDDLSFAIAKGETLCLVGESGSGKSVSAYSVMRLIPEPPGRIESGEIIFEGANILNLSERDMRQIRGRRISMIFQEPMSALNPVYTVGNQIIEVINLHQGLNGRLARAAAAELLDMVGIADPISRLSAFPHELSGGMRQRVMIAIALACRPSLLIADEPTTALDVTIQAQILELLQRLKRDLGMAILFITHDLGVVSEIADRVMVMYAGRSVEQGTVREVLNNPAMPYTKGLINSLPSLQLHGNNSTNRLAAIPGSVPGNASQVPGCAFHPRCDHVVQQCIDLAPGFEQIGEDHGVRCFRWRELLNSYSYARAQS